MVTSNNAILNVVSAPTITQHPQSQTFLAGNNVTFTAAATGTGVQFEWQRTDDELVLPYACDPELAKQPLQFIPSKYQDPGFIALPALPSTPPSPTRDGGSAANAGSNSRP